MEPCTWNPLACRSSGEEQAVNDAVNVMSESVMTALGLSKQIVAQQKGDEDKMKKLLEDVRYQSGGGIDDMKSESDQTLDSDQANFQGDLQSVINAGTDAQLKFESKLSRATMQRDTRVSTVKGRVDRPGEREGACGYYLS